MNKMNITEQDKISLISSETTKCYISGKETMNGQYSFIPSMVRHNYEAQLIKLGKIYYGRNHFVDLGCGMGNVVLLMALHYPDKTCVGIDLDHTLLQQAITLRNKLKLNNAHFIQSDIISYPIRKFNAIYTYMPMYGQKLEQFLGQLMIQLYHGTDTVWYEAYHDKVWISCSAVGISLGNTPPS